MPNDLIHTPTSVSTFLPTPADETALRVFLETGGSIAKAMVEARVSRASITRAMKSQWWIDKCKEAGFSPMTAKQMGDMVNREVGHKALEILETQWDALGIDDLTKLSRVGKDLQDAGESAGPVGRIHVLAQIDFRGLDRETLQRLRGPADDEDLIRNDDSEVVDAEWEDAG